MFAGFDCKEGRMQASIKDLLHHYEYATTKLNGNY